MTLSDEVIGQLAKLVQLAILTGTDIVDNLRKLEQIRKSSLKNSKIRYDIGVSFYYIIDEILTESEDLYSILSKYCIYNWGSDKPNSLNFIRY